MTPRPGAAPDSGRVKVAVVEDQPRIREGLRFILDSTADFRCVAALGSVEEALAGLPEADVVLMDTACPAAQASRGSSCSRRAGPSS